MKVILHREAEKQLKNLNEPMYSRIARAILSLGNEPPHGDIKKLSGRDDFRLRVGEYRILYEIRTDSTMNHEIFITDIKPRGSAYKGGKKR